MNYIRKEFAKLTATVAVAGFALLRSLPAMAALEDETGLSATGTAANVVSETDVSVIVGGTILRVGGLIGTVFFALLVYGGAIWMTAQGSDEKIKKAKGIITSAVIGLIVTIAAYSISSYVLRIAAVATSSGDIPLK